MLLESIDFFGKLEHQVSHLQVDKFSSLCVWEIRVIRCGEVPVELVDFEGMERIQRLLNHLIEFHFIKYDKETLPELVHLGFAHDALEGFPIMCSHIFVIVVFEEVLSQGISIVVILLTDPACITSVRLTVGKCGLHHMGLVLMPV
jgi:hypothetical protein